MLEDDELEIQGNAAAIVAELDALLVDLQDPMVRAARYPNS